MLDYLLLEIFRNNTILQTKVDSQLKKKNNIKSINDIRVKFYSCWVKSPLWHITSCLWHNPPSLTLNMAIFGECLSYEPHYIWSVFQSLQIARDQWEAVSIQYFSQALFFQKISIWPGSGSRFAGLKFKHLGASISEGKKNCEHEILFASE